MKKRATRTTPATVIAIVDRQQWRVPEAAYNARLAEYDRTRDLATLEDWIRRNGVVEVDAP